MNNNLNKNCEEPIVTFLLLSDVHVGAGGEIPANKRFIDALDEFNVNNPKADTLVITGDITNTGKDSEYEEFFNILYENKHIENTAIAIGNHDLRWNGGYDIAFPRYKTRYLDKMGIDTAYFSKQIHGYTFVILNSEKDLKDEAYLSESQLTWLDNILSQEKGDKPVFIGIHQPLSKTFPYSYDWSVGEQENQLRDILAKYPQCILINGHIHNVLGSVEEVDGVNLSMFYRDDKLTAIEVPSLMEHGQGYYVNVYEDRVVLVARDFINKLWLPEHDKEIAIN